MPDPFYTVRCVARVDDEFNTYREVYLIGPQFCGGEKHVIAKVFPEAEDAAGIDDPELLGGLPDEVTSFLRWARENVICPVQR
jgi:hypothetical protein